MRRWTKAGRLLEKAVESGDAPGLVAGVTTRDGIAYLGASGVGRSDGAPLAADWLFWIGSMTKAITSVAALQLVERGKLKLDAPLGDLVPELAGRPILAGFDAGGQPILRQSSRPITLARLLSHTSGFAESVWNADLARYARIAGIPETVSGKAAALDLPLVFEPGTGWHYGISHDWAGRVVERASGKRLDRYFADEIFGPLGMVDSGYFLADGRKERLAELHVRGKEGRLLPQPRVLPAEREFIPGGGALLSTAGDYLAFARMLLNRGEAGGRRLLSPATVDLLPLNRTGDMPVSRLDPAMPGMSNKVEFLPGIRKCWGLGLMVNLEDLPGGRRAGSLAWAGLGNTYFWIDPASGIAGVLLSQILPFADPRIMRLFAEFEKAVYDTIGS
jgi:CubicO group peptidase (beta-lactamase class C family)